MMNTFGPAVPGTFGGSFNGLPPARLVIETETQVVEVSEILAMMWYGDTEDMSLDSMG